MALLAQVRDSEVAAFDIVDTDAAPSSAGLAVDEHDRQPTPGEDIELRRLLLHRRDQHPPHPLLEQQVEVVRLPERVPVAVAQVQRDSGAAGDLLDASGHVGEEGVRRIEHDIGDRSAEPGPQLTAGLVAHEAELCDRSDYFAAGRFADGVRPVQDVRHRSDRHSGQGRHVLHPYGAVPHLVPPRSLNRFNDDSRRPHGTA